MFSHVTVGAFDLDAAKRFYDPVLGSIGMTCRLDDRSGGWLSYVAAGRRRPEFLVCRPIDGRPAAVGNGITIGFEAHSRAEVDRFHAAALLAGGSSEGQPGLRPNYHADYYGAYVRDPTGNKLCCVCHAPASKDDE